MDKQAHIEEAERYAQEAEELVNASRVAPGRPDPLLVPQEIIDEDVEAGDTSN